MRNDFFNTEDRLIFRNAYVTLLHRYTITMTKEERKALKQIALDKDITVSALIRMWLQEQQKAEVKE